MFISYSRRGSHRRMTVRSLKNRKAILLLNQDRKCFGNDSEEYNYSSCIDKPNRNRTQPVKMEWFFDGPASMNSAGWKTSTRRKKQWKYSRPSCKGLNAIMMEVNANSDEWEELENFVY